MQPRRVRCYEHYPWRATIECMEPERLLSFRRHDFDETSGVDIPEQRTTLVEFRLEPTAEGTRLTITESGFESIPNPRRLEHLRSNTQGWESGRRTSLIMSRRPRELTASPAAPVFAALGDATRLSLLNRLCG